MIQYGTGSVYGVDGTVTHSGTARAVLVQSVDSSHSAQLEKFLSGQNKMLGYNKSMEVLAVDLVLIPKAANLAAAKTGLDYPNIPSKVTLSGMVTSAGEADSTNLNGDYCYEGDASKTVVQGQAGFRMRIYRYIDSDLTSTQLTTLVPCNLEGK